MIVQLLLCTINLFSVSVSDPLFFFTDPDPTQKPKADPDPDPGKSTSNCVKRIINTKRKNVRILPLGHNQISAVICRPISIFLNISKSQ